MFVANLLIFFKKAMQKELKQVIELFLLKNNVSYNKEELKLQLLTHPYFPSINAITDLFDHFEIENIAAELPKEEAIINELPESFLAHIKENNIEKIILVKKRKDSLKLVYDKNLTKTVTYNQFLDIWTGVIIAIEKEEEKKIISKFNSGLKAVIFSLLIASILSIIVFNLPTLRGLIYFILSCLGIYIGVLLVQKELGLHSKTLDRFCEASEKHSCDDILNSKGATILGLFKLSDVGIIYFSGISLAFIVNAISNTHTNYTLFYLISVASALFIPYSLYYQWKIVKKWCPLCLIVLGILFSQMITLVVYQSIVFTFDLSSFLIIVFSFLFLISIWILLKPALKKQQEFEVLQLEYFKFKRNIKLFTTALQSSEPVSTDIPDIQEISFGKSKSNALLQIVLVTNPLCFFCKESHKVIHKIFNNHSKNIHLTTRFNINTATVEDNKGLEISNELMGIYITKGEEVCSNALDEIYSDTEPDKWLQKWKTSSEINHLEVFEKEKEWCTKNNINFTPAVFINGYLFPKEYKISDLPFFIDSLIEQDT